MSLRAYHDQLDAEAQAERRERPIRCGFRELIRAIAAAEAASHGMDAALRWAA